MGARAGANGTPLRFLGVTPGLQSTVYAPNLGALAKGWRVIGESAQAAGTMSFSRAGDEGCQLSSANLRFALACISSGASKTTVRAHSPTQLTLRR